MTEPRDTEKTLYESIQQADQDALPRPPPVHRQRTKWEKLGPYNVGVLTAGTVVILVSLGFLTFLWIVSIRQSSTNHLPRLWISIVRRDWTTRVVTLATMLIRIAVAAQLCVFAALMAALILERVGASTEDLPLLSMIRCANTGPQALIWNVLHTITKGTQLGYSFLIIITILNALALQFISTILLADFRTDLVILQAKTERVLWAITESQNTTALQGNNFWKAGQNSYPTFAEYKQNASHGATFKDTGKTYRGFLPFANATLREALMHYSGPMTVVDERVVCVKPTLSNTFFRIPQRESNTINGNFVFNNTNPDVIQSDHVAGFNCTMPDSFWKEKFWQVSLCQLGRQVGGLRDGILPDPGYEISGIDTGNTTAWLFLNLTSPTEFNYTQILSESSGTIIIPLNQLDSPDGPWAKVGSTNVTVDISLCLLNPHAEVYAVEASSTRETYSTDSLLTWISEDSKYDTTLPRIRLDAISVKDLQEADLPTSFIPSQEQRGVLKLHPVTDWNAARGEAKYNASYTTYVQMIVDSIYQVSSEASLSTAISNSTFVLTPDAREANTIHRSLMWIVQDILVMIGDPALALQALTHTVMQAAYYDLYNNFDLVTDETHTEMEPRYIPYTWRSLAAVLGLLVLHAALVLIALFLFATRTEMSLLGNSWQAVAQVMSNDTADAMHQGTMATDHELRNSVKGSGTAEQRIMIARSERNGRLEAVSVKHNN